MVDEKSKLTRENDTLLYNLAEIEKEKREADAEMARLRVENQTYK